MLNIGFPLRMDVIQAIAGLGEDSGGPSRTVSALAGHLCKVVDRVALLTIHRAGESIVQPPGSEVSLRFAADGIGVDRYRQSPTRKLLAQLLPRAGPALVHDHGIWLPFNHAIASVCRQSADTVRLVSPRGMLEPWALGFGALKKRIAWFAYQLGDLRSAKGFHATSDSEAASVRRLGLAQPIAIIPNAVTVPRVLPVKTREMGRRQQALFLSRIHPKKGLLDLITAWGLVRPENWCLSIVGGDERGHRKEVEALICSQGLQNAISVASQVSDAEKWGLYAESDLFILPSYSENFGVVVAEAMHMGLPVITTTATPWYIIQEAHCGWYTDPGIAPLKAALEKAFASPAGQLASMGARGRQVVADRFDWDRVALQMAEFYRWMIGGGTRPRYVHVD